MKVIREKTILNKIDEEIDDKSKPPIARIDLDEDEFGDFISCLSEGVISISFQGILTGLKTEVVDKVTRSSISKRNGNWSGSYVVYRDVYVQCCYEKE